MAKTVFRVMNSNPDFEIPAGSGFWFTNQSDGGIAIDDQGTVDDSDDTILDEQAPTATKGSDERGTWVFVSPAGLTSTVGDTVNIGTPLEKFENMYDFEVDGDAADPRTNAGMLFLGLNNESFVWLPKNPEYNTVAPLLKDGVTANPDFDNLSNPFLVDGTTNASKVGDVCQHFIVETVVV